MRRRLIHAIPRRRATWLFSCVALAATLVAAGRRNQPAAAEPASAAQIVHDLRSFRVMATVLHVGAHPDDENTQLIAYLARGRAYRTAYLSVTRGDGGQNLLGPELSEKLGVARTQELLAARRIDGGRQFFTRAIDFGFSKDYRETLDLWGHEQVLGDVVRVIRLFRPDVIITRFSTQPGGTHGHHTTSAVLALEAFKLAGDPKAYPEQLTTLNVWQPKRIFMNAGRGGGGGENATGLVQMNVSGDDPVLGESFSVVASRSRGMHKTQGFGQPGGGGGGGGGGRGGGSGARLESFQLLAGEPATTDIIEGVDTTWNRVAGGAEIGRLINDVIAKFNPQDPSASVPALLAIRTRLAALPKDIILDEKRQLLDRIIQECVGLEVETVIPQAEVVPGEPLRMRHTVMVRSNFPVRWTGVRYPGAAEVLSGGMLLRANTPAVLERTHTLPANTPLTQPYWLRAEGSAGLFRVDDPSLIGRPENPPEFPVELAFEIGGQTITIPDEPVQVLTSASGETRSALDVISPVALRFVPEVGVFAPGASREVKVELRAARANSAGTLRLNAPAGWRVTPASQAFRLARLDDRATFAFNVTAPPRGATASIGASAIVSGATFTNQRIEIAYDHIPLQLLQPAARLKASSFELATRGRNIGYIPGAGDNVAESIEQMGYTVTRLEGPDLTPEKLRTFDAVVIGIRAFNVRTDLAPAMPALFSYVENGGVVIAQYNQTGGLRTPTLAPYPLTVSQDRVTEERAAVTFLAPDHPSLNTPNKITSADFEGWVQERGLYFPNQWDEHFTPIIASGDTGEAPLKGGLVIAKHGRGYYVYTGLAFFRQLPAGVPGAYRLFANLLSLGKGPRT